MLTFSCPQGYTCNACKFKHCVQPVEKASASNLHKNSRFTYDFVWRTGEKESERKAKIDWEEERREGPIHAGTGAHYRSLQMCCTLESTLSSEELFLEQQAFPPKYIVSAKKKIPARFRHCYQSFFRTHKKVYVNEQDRAEHWLVDWLLCIRAWQILRENHF